MASLTEVQNGIAAYRLALIPPATPPVTVTPPPIIVTLASMPMTMVQGTQTVALSYNPSNGVWTGTPAPVQFGIPGDMPLIIEWQGGNHIAVWRPGTNQVIVNSDNTSYHGSNQVIL